MTDKKDGDTDKPTPDNNNLPPPATSNPAVPPVQPMAAVPAVENDPAKDAAVHEENRPSQVATNQNLAERIKSSDRWMIVLTAIIAAATIGNVWVYYRESEGAGKQTDKLITAANTQACAASKNAGAADKFALSADGINKQTKLAVDQFRRLANDTETTIRNSQQSFRQEQRPYLWAQPHGGFMDPGEKNNTVLFNPKPDKSGYTFAAAVNIKNSGRSPAIEVFASNTEYKFGPAKEVIEELRNYSPIYRPSGILVSDNVMTPVSATIEISNDDFERFKRGEYAMAIVGGVKYRDMFSPKITPYETTYCIVIKPEGMAFGGCNIPATHFGDSIK